jgi:hypothetical protein
VTSYLSDNNDHKKILKVLKYIFSQVTFAGKLTRQEDLRKLSAHVEDLFSESVALAYSLEINLDKSHLGFPKRDHDLN